MYFISRIIETAGAFLIGNEGKIRGLTDEITALADQQQIKIPMKGKVESLNAAVSATMILMYETMRQREFISDVQ